MGEASPKELARPFKILSRHGFERIDFEPLTILYGGNGSGKSTALNELQKIQEMFLKQNNVVG